MKKFLLAAVMTTVFSAVAMADNLDMMKIVVNSRTVNELSASMKDEGFDTLLKVEMTARARCPGCYIYTLTFETNDQQVSTKSVQTEMDLASREVTVTVIE
ncbi:MAG: hypothetical protein AB7T49_05575 [Oligoflexales bacterium]